MWKCVNCGTENRSNRDNCWKCGIKADGTAPANFERSSASDPLEEGAKNIVPPLEAQSPSSISEAIEIKALMSRYWDAYVVAKVTVGFGESIKAVAMILAVLIILAALLIAGSVGGGGAVLTFLLGVIGAAFVGGQFYLLGLIVMAQGQILRASLDGAVNSSPFLENHHRAKIMSLK